jgi:hypothetical protein
MTNGITLATSSQSDIPFILPLSISHFISVAVCTSKDKQLAESFFRCNYICVFLFCNPRHKVGSSGHLTLIQSTVTLVLSLSQHHYFRLNNFRIYFMDNEFDKIIISKFKI